MATRNPMNDRYQGDGPGGQTRKSAASAKPKKRAAETVHVESAPKTKDERRKAKAAKEKMERKQREKLMAGSAAPTVTAEYKRYRRWWWATLAIAIAATALSWGLRYWLPDNLTPSYIALGLAYAGLIAAFVIDFKFVKPIRDSQKNIATKPLSKNERKQLAKQEEAEAARKAAAEQERKAQGGLLGSLGLGGFGNKKKADEVATVIEQETASLEETSTTSKAPKE